MENDIALMASGYVAIRFGLLALFAYIIYRVLKPSPKAAPIRSQSYFASERSAATRSYSNRAPARREKLEPVPNLSGASKCVWQMDREA